LGGFERLRLQRKIYAYRLGIGAVNGPESNYVRFFWR
jgi:hypothetical protein